MKYFDNDGYFKREVDFDSLFDESGFCLEDFEDEIMDNYEDFHADSEIVGCFYAIVFNDGEFTVPQDLMYRFLFENINDEEDEFSDFDDDFDSDDEFYDDEDDFDLYDDED